MEKKPWYTSTTIWSLITIGASVFAPKYAPVIPSVVGDLGTIAGLIGGVIGRLRATKEVTFTAPKSE